MNKGYNMTRQQKKELERFKNTRLYVKVQDNNVEKALSQFKKRVKNSGLLKELRDREHYEKKSTRKRRKRNSVKLRRKYLNNT